MQWIVLCLDITFKTGEMSLLVALGFDLLVALELPFCSASLLAALGYSP